MPVELQVCSWWGMFRRKTERKPSLWKWQLQVAPASLSCLPVGKVQDPYWLNSRYLQIVPSSQNSFLILCVFFSFTSLPIAQLQMALQRQVQLQLQQKMAAKQKSKPPNS